MRSNESSGRWPLFFGITILALFADIATKYMVSAGLWTGESLGGLLRITLVNNPGAAFGLFPGARWAFITIKLLALIVILTIMARRGIKGLDLTAPLALIFSGALGNLLDRLRAPGQVVDFIDFGFGAQRWYVFNVADACISVGALLLILTLMRRPAPDQPAL